jgi:hypothetical protein
VPSFFMGANCQRRALTVTYNEGWEVIENPATVPLTRAQSARAQRNWRRVRVVVVWLRARERWAAFGLLLQRPNHRAVWHGVERNRGVLSRTLFFDGEQNSIPNPKASAKAKAKAKSKAKAKCSPARR